MFPNFLTLPRDGRQAGGKERAPHRLAAAAAAAPDAAAPLSPRSPSARLAAAATSSSTVGSPRARAAALPAYRALLGRQSQRLPHVQPSAERAPASYTSLEGLRKLAELHTGKHSQVCSFLDTRTGQLVAVKTYYKRTMAKRHYRNVRREIAISRLLARQRFTGAVQLLGAFEDDSHIYLVQESCAGGDLYRRLVRAGGVLSEAEVARDVVVPLLLTLTFLHANNIVHRDIKPENVFFTAEGGLRLGDFGLAIDAARERPTSRVGTLDYMAPEVVSMPSPDTIKRLGLTQHQVGHYGPKVDVWALGILTYELTFGRPPFEVEDVRQTEQQIQFGEVVFPEHYPASPLLRSFIQQALTKRAESRPSAAQLFQHPWVQAHYRQLAAEQRQSAAAAMVAAAGAAMCTPELRRTVSQPPSPSKSVPGMLPLGLAQAGEGSRTPAAVAAALAPFLPPSQAKQAHKVRLLSPGRPPSSSKGAGPRRRRLSDPLGRVQAAPPIAAAVAAAAVAAAAAEPASGAVDADAAAPDVPPATPPPATTPAAASDGAGAVAAAGDLDDAAASGSLAAAFETPGTPGVQVTPLPRQRPVVVPPPRLGPLGRGPFSLPQLSTPGASSVVAAAAGEAVPQPTGGVQRRAAAPGRSRFAAAVENDEVLAVAAVRQSTESLGAAGLGSPIQQQARSGSLSSLAVRQEGSSGDLAVCGRAASFSSFRSPSGGNLSLQVAARASSFTSFGGSSSNLSNIMGSRPGSSKQLEGLEEAADGSGADAAGDQLRRLHLAG